VLYWKVQNSWGAAQTVLSYSKDALGMVRKDISYPEGGYFRIKRGENFCGIESQLVYASALKDLHSDQRLQSNLGNNSNITVLSRSAGGWHELSGHDAHVGVSTAMDHLNAHVQQQGGARRDGQPEFHKHTATKVLYQSVAGSNYHLTVTAEHVATGELYEMEGIIHRDLAGQHFIKHQTRLRKKDTAAEPKNTENTMNGDTTKASSAPVNSVAVQESTDSDGNVNVPPWALWLNGALIAALLTAIAGLLYANASLRQQLSGAPTTAIKLEEAPHSRAASQTAVEIVSKVDDASTATLKASIPRSPASTELRSRSASHEGVICLD